MPIQISTSVVPADVDTKIHSYEERFGMSSKEFLENPLVHSIPEDIMIEWDFLLMQRAAFEETAMSGQLLFSPRFKSTLRIQEAQDIYEGVAA